MAVRRLLGESGWDRLAVAAIAVGAAARGVWVLILHQPFDYLYSDMEAYFERASALADGDPLERFDAFYPPGTHVLLAAPLAVFGDGRTGMWAAAALWALLSSATPLFVWRFARLLLTRAGAALAAAFSAFWPLHITSAGYFLSETPALAFLAAALWAGYRATQGGRRATVSLGAGAGVLGGVAVANRPQFVLNLAVLALPWLRRWRRFVWPLLALAAGFAVVMVAVVAHNSEAAGKPTGVSENSGMTFFLGHCDVRNVEMGQAYPATIFQFGAPVAAQRGGGHIYVFPEQLPWDQRFFFGQGADCIRADGFGHVRITGRSILDMTATTVLWPQSNERYLRDVVNFTNIAYAVMLPIILAASVLLIDARRRRGEPAGEAALLVHLLCVLVTAVVFFGDPRFRMPYDIFGLALLGSLVAYWGFERRLSPDRVGAR